MKFYSWQFYKAFKWWLLHFACLYYTNLQSGDCLLCVKLRCLIPIVVLISPVLHSWSLYWTCFEMSSWCDIQLVSNIVRKAVMFYKDILLQCCMCTSIIPLCVILCCTLSEYYRKKVAPSQTLAIGRPMGLMKIDLQSEVVSLSRWNYRVKPENTSVNMWSWYQSGLNIRVVFKRGFTVVLLLLGRGGEVWAI